MIDVRAPVRRGPLSFRVRTPKLASVAVALAVLLIVGGKLGTAAVTADELFGAAPSSGAAPSPGAPSDRSLGESA